MNTEKAADKQPTLKKYSTGQVAMLLTHAPQSVRSALCRDGAFMGMRPVKLPNGRLLWDAAAVHALMNGEVA